MTSAIRALGAAISIDWVDVSAMLGRLPRTTRCSANDPVDDTRPVARVWR